MKIVPQIAWEQIGSIWINLDQNPDQDPDFTTVEKNVHDYNLCTFDPDQGSNDPLSDHATDRFGSTKIMPQIASEQQSGECFSFGSIT